MNYIENIFICIAAPLLVAALCSNNRKNRRVIIQLLGGVLSCLLSSYISTFLVGVYRSNTIMASVEITPAVEETMKLVPILFFMLVFEPDKETIANAIQMVAIGFATFENICYLTQNGAERVFYLLIRGFGTGAMHVVCGAIVAVGLWFLWDYTWLRVAGTVGLLAFAITYHAVYNMLVSRTGMAVWIRYFIPLLTVILFVIFRGRGPALRSKAGL